MIGPADALASGFLLGIGADTARHEVFGGQHWMRARCAPKKLQRVT